MDTPNIKSEDENEVRRIIEEIQSLVEKNRVEFLGRPLVSAYRGGHQNIIHSVWSYIDEQNLFDSEPEAREFVLSSCLAAAVEGGHTNLINELIHQGANNWNRGLQSAAKTKRLDLVHFFLEKEDLHNRNELRYRAGLEGAAEGGHYDLVRYFIELGAVDVNSAINKAICQGHSQIALYLIDKANVEVGSSWFYSWIENAKVKCPDLVDYLELKETEWMRQNRYGRFKAFVQRKIPCCRYS